MVSVLTVLRTAGVVVVALGMAGFSGFQAASAATTRSGTVSVPKNSPVGINGRLTVCRKTKICNSYSNPIQLRGISSHGLQWYSQCINNLLLKALAKDWRADVIRLSMYVQEGGYETDPDGYTALVDKLI
jgi:endoglucanase